MNDMERIHRGLEAFLDTQMEDDYEDYKRYDDEEEYDDYEEDWDAERRPGKQRRREGRPVETPRRRREERPAEAPRRRREERPAEAPRRRRKEPAEDPRRKQKKKKKSRIKRFFFKLLLLAALLAAGLFFIVDRAYDKLNYEEIGSLASEPMKEDGVINILLIGNDSRENGEDGRSDAMILLSVSSKTKKIYMTSLLRDMYVEIPGHKSNRLNAAYSYGGPELLMQTVEKNLDISVNRYMLVNFEAFANLVDAVGGVDLELSTGELELVNGYLNEYNMLTGKEFGTDYLDTTKEGMTHLNGPQALAYTRNRYIGTDFGRTERQRKVLTEVLHQLPKAALHPITLTDGLLPNLTTNLTEFECYRLSLLLPFMLSYDLEHGSIPVEGTYKDATIREMAVLEVDFEANKAYLKQMLWGEEE